jgi:hypothetical protein
MGMPAFGTGEMKQKIMNFDYLILTNYLRSMAGVLYCVLSEICSNEEESSDHFGKCIFLYYLLLRLCYRVHIFSAFAFTGSIMNVEYYSVLPRYCTFAK